MSEIKLLYIILALKNGSMKFHPYSDTFHIDFRYISYIFQIHFILISYWFHIGFMLIPCWFHIMHWVILSKSISSWRVVELQCRRDHQRSGNICSLYSFYIFQISHHIPTPPLSPSPTFPLAQKRSFFVPVPITFKLHKFRTTKTNCQHKWLTNSPPGMGQNWVPLLPTPFLT